MTDYIRREDALKALQNNFYSTAMDIINRVPPADVTEVVRCKDCKHWQRHTGVVDSPNGHCFALETCTNGTDFCSYGERQTNGGTDNATD